MTNFYWLKTDEDSVLIESDDPELHLGSMSELGPYCKECGISMCRSGTKYAKGYLGQDAYWHDECPRCGAAALNMPQLRMFEWTMFSHYKKLKAQRQVRKHIIRDSQGRRYTKKMFLNLLDTCMIQHQYYGEWQ